jgi:hypothetical protein
MSSILSIDYTNHRGERAWREVVPLAIRFGSTPWHEAEQWVLEAVELAKGGPRSFALLAIHGIAGPGRPRWRSDAEARLIARVRYLEEVLDQVAVLANRLRDATPGKAVSLDETLAAVDRMVAAAAARQGSTPADPGDGVARIGAERARQVEQEGFDAAHDDEHTSAELARAAASLALASFAFDPALNNDRAERLPELSAWLMPAAWELGPRGPIRDLERAGALIAAEIDRRLRAGNPA